MDGCTKPILKVEKRINPPATENTSSWNTFFFWFKTHPRICITDVELAKQILSNKLGLYRILKPRSFALAIGGWGLGFIDGPTWTRHRRAISPAFTMEKLKGMVKAMAACTLTVLDRWQEQQRESESQSVQIEMCKEFLELTADIISHTAFGQSSSEGKAVFEAQRQLLAMFASSYMAIEFPGSRYLPTKTNRKRWELEKTMNDTLTRVVRSRLDHKDSSCGCDLLGVMLEASRNPRSGEKEVWLGMDEIIDECKTFFFTGHETTAHLLSWTIFLLASNPEWQERLRFEVQEKCAADVPDADSIGKLKLVHMVLLEALRLYSPAIELVRKATRDAKLGSLEIPEDAEVVIPIALMHRSKEVWGADANEFNPFRFTDGISNAVNHPNAWLAFSVGPRACIGQNFAMLEAKIVIAMILRRFSISLSPSYKHAPTAMLALQPQFGLPVIVKAV